MPRVAAVVLAAGASTRMGRPKALLEWRGRPFVRHAVEQARAAQADPIVVVQGAVALPDAALDGVRRVLNPDWADGPLGSLQRGMQALRPDGLDDAGVLVLTVDRPHLRASTLRALAESYRAEPRGLWQPRHHQRRGHPILYPADLVPAVVALRPPQTPRTLLARPEVAARRRACPVDDPAILDNLDRPADLARLPP